MPGLRGLPRQRRSHLRAAGRHEPHPGGPANRRRWVLGTPVYYAHLSGYLKLAIDRMYSLWTTEGGWRLGLTGKRRGAVVVVQADAEEETPQKVADYLFPC